MPPPITIANRFGAAIALIGILALIIKIGVSLLRVIGRASPMRRLHGRFVLGWMIAGWAVGGCVGVILLDNKRYFLGETDVGLAGTGLLAGWIVGMIHGGVVVWWRLRNERGKADRLA